MPRVHEKLRAGARNVLCLVTRSVHSLQLLNQCEYFETRCLPLLLLASPGQHQSLKPIPVRIEDIKTGAKATAILLAARLALSALPSFLTFANFGARTATLLLLAFSTKASLKFASPSPRAHITFRALRSCFRLSQSAQTTLSQALFRAENQRGSTKKTLQ